VCFYFFNMKRTLLDVSAGAGETEPTTQAEAAETDAVPASPPPPLGLGDVIGISEMYDEIFEHRSDLPTQVALSFVNKACRAAFANRILPRVRARAAAAAAVGDRVQTTPDLYLVHYLLETTVAAPRRYSALFRYFVEHVVGGGLNAHLLATRLLGAGVVLAALADAGLTDDLLWFVDRIEPALARKALVFYKFAARLPTRADMERVYAHLNEPFDRDALLTGPALYYMIEGGHTDTVRWLFEEKRRHHADAREMNEMKRLAFVWAVEFGTLLLPLRCCVAYVSCLCSHRARRAGQVVSSSPAGQRYQGRGRSMGRKPARRRRRPGQLRALFPGPDAVHLRANARHGRRD
jgi:hypothetical protein